MPDIKNYEPGLNNPVVAGTGGTKAVTLGAGSTAPAICFGSGAPSFAAPKGSLYLATDGTTTNDRLYICSVATGTWVNVTTAS
jgi:hypothetical protein